MPTPFKSQFDPPLSPEKERAILNALERMDAEEELRQREQGLGVPIMGVSLEGNALVQVGDRRITATGCRTFHDFLFKYLWALLEVEWLLSEKEKPENDQHWIVRWRLRAIEEQKAVPTPELGGRRLMSGAELSLLKLAYNLYLIEHNSPLGQGYKRVCQFVRRLKNGTEGNFFGALFETHVSAMFLVAGFDVDYLPEEIGDRRYSEFVATYRETGRQFSVEAKARVFQSEATTKSKAKALRVRNKIYDALQKDCDHQRIILLGYMLPELVRPGASDSWEVVARDEVKAAELSQRKDGAEFDPAYVLIANYAFQNQLGYGRSEFECVAYGFKMPDFQRPTSYPSFLDYLDSKERHKEVEALFESLRSHTNVPATFDGSLPEFEFGEPDELRLIIGNTYQIEIEQGSLVSGVLEDAVVIESDNAAFCLLRTTDGATVRAQFPLTELAMNAWRRAPDLFFGHRKPLPKQIKSLVELAEFHFENSKKISRESLIERLRKVIPLEQLNQMDHRALAAEFAHRLAAAQWARDPRNSEGEVSAPPTGSGSAE